MANRETYEHLLDGWRNHAAVVCKNIHYQVRRLELAMEKGCPLCLTPCPSRRRHLPDDQWLFAHIHCPAGGFWVSVHDGGLAPEMDSTRDRLDVAAATAGLTEAPRLELTNREGKIYRIEVFDHVLQAVSSFGRPITLWRDNIQDIVGEVTELLRVAVQKSEERKQEEEAQIKAKPEAPRIQRRPSIKRDLNKKETRTRIFQEIEQYRQEQKSALLTQKKQGELNKLLPPLTMKQIADRILVSETTVWRYITKDKVLANTFEKLKDLEYVTGVTHIDAQKAGRTARQEPGSSQKICPSCKEPHSFKCGDPDCKQPDDGRCETCHNEKVHGTITDINVPDEGGSPSAKSQR